MKGEEKENISLTGGFFQGMRVERRGVLRSGTSGVVRIDNINEFAHSRRIFRRAWHVNRAGRDRPTDRPTESPRQLVTSSGAFSFRFIWSEHRSAV